MKIILFISCLLFVLYSCNEEKIVTNDLGSCVQTRGLVTDSSPSITNPNLLTDWESLRTVILNRSTESNQRTASLPWVQGATTTIPAELAQDIKKEDGWEMLLHTFKNYGEDEKSNYMIFYNRFSGFLKVFYYLDDVPSPNNGFLWQLRTNGGTPTSLFSVNGFFALPDNSISKNSEVVLSNMAQTPASGVSLGWNGFQMEIPYSIDYHNLSLAIQGYNNHLITYDFSGKSSSTTEGTIIKTVSSGSGLTKSVASLAGPAAKNGINSLVKSKGVQLGSKITNAILGISTGGYVSAISAGLKFIGGIFGSKSSTETEKVNLTTTGTMTMSGSSTDITTSSIAPISPIDIHTLFHGEDVGVWTLKDSPLINCERYTTVNGDLHLNNTSVWGSITNSTTYYPRKTIEATVIINPSLEKYIVAKNIRFESVICDSLNGTLYAKKWKIVDSLLYKDSQTCLYESNSSMYYTFPNGGAFPHKKGCRPLYDWGKIQDDGDIVNVTVELTFKINNKEIKTVSSRYYEPKYYVPSTDDDIILHQGIPFIVNDPYRF